MRLVIRHLPVLLAGLALLACALVSAPGSSPRATDLRPAFASTCIGYCTHPTNAAKVFRWGREAWRQEFEVGSLSSHWKSNQPSLVSQQQGMLTIRAYPGTGYVKVWPDNQHAQYGRWEARVRAVDQTTGAGEYQFNWELAPTSGYHCGARSIVLASYHPGDTAATGAVHTLPNLQFSFARKLDLRSRAWHTYAVEVTPTHISWFVDTKVVRTERRPAALSGVTFRPQFRIVGVPGETMNQSMMQMDWVRYYTLKRPDAHSISAPQMTRGTYAGAC